MLIIKFMHPNYLGYIYFYVLFFSLDQLQLSKQKAILNNVLAQILHLSE